jgi:lantibiotic transport system permease protein
MKAYWHALLTEMIKGRRTFALWQSFLFPLFTVMLIGLALSGTKIEEANPWSRFVHNFANTTAFFLPFFLVIIIGYYSNIEHKSNAWKHLLTQPVPKISLFLGKLSMILILVMLSYCFMIILGYCASFLLHLINPVKFHFNLGGISFNNLVRILLKTYLSGFMIIAIQYWLSLRFRNLIIPFVIGVSLIILPIAVLIVLGMAGLLHQPKSLQNIFSYDPYSYPFAHIFNFLKSPQFKIDLIPRMTLIYMGLSVIVFFLSYLDFRKRNF